MGSVFRLLIINDSHTNIPTVAYHKIVAFANDILVLVAAVCLRSLAIEPLDRIMEWSKKYKLNFNIEKK